MTENILAMVPVGDQDRHGIEYVVQPHMRHHLCEQCPTICWTGPRQLKMKEENPNMPMLCMNCVMKIAMKEQQAGFPFAYDIKKLGG